MKTSAIIFALRKLNAHGVANTINTVVTEPMIDEKTLVKFAGRVLAAEAIKVSKTWKLQVLTTVSY